MANSIPHYIPRDILEEVLARLPFESVVKCRGVCSIWSALLSDPYFIALHSDLIKQNENNLRTMVCNGFDLFSVEFESFGPRQVRKMSNYDFEIRCGTRVVGSWNGWICICHGYSNEFYIWNPETGKSIKVPTLKIPHALLDSEFDSNGFGYHCADKSFVIIKTFTSDLETSVYYYSESNSCWENLESIEYKLSDTGGSLFNGSLHWPAIDCNSLDMHCDDTVVRYSIEGRKFMKFPLPNTTSKMTIHGAGVLRGCFYILASKKSESTILEAWVMQEYHNQDSWYQLFRVLAPRSWVRMVPLYYIKKGTSILISDNNGFYEHSLPCDKKLKQLCEETDEKLQKFIIKEIPSGPYESAIYKEHTIGFW